MSSIPKEIFIPREYQVDERVECAPYDFSLNRPQNPTPRAQEVRWLILTDENTSIEDDAIGIKFDSDKVVLGIAVVHPFGMMNTNAAQYFAKRCSKLQRDRFGWKEKAACKFQNRCNRSCCTFYHGRPNESSSFPASVRVCPPPFRKNIPGFSTSGCTSAAVLWATFRYTNGMLDVTSMTAEWKMEDVGPCEAVTDENMARDRQEITVITQVCTALAKLPSSFQETFGDALDIVELQKPIDAGYWRESLAPKGDRAIQVPELPHLVFPVRGVVSIRRFVTDTLLELFCDQALLFLQHSAPQVKVVALSVKQLPPDAIKELEPVWTHKSYEYVETLGVTARSLLEKICVAPSEERVADTHNRMRIKFSAPLRRFDGMHNFTQLCAALGDRSSQAIQGHLAFNNDSWGQWQRSETLSLRLYPDTRVPPAMGVRLRDGVTLILRSDEVIIDTNSPQPERQRRWQLGYAKK